MIFTHEEAKTKWCPFARVYSIGGDTGQEANGSWNRHPNQFGEEPRCIADGCMAWREGPDKMVWDDKGKPEYLQRGYCGLAGKP